MRSGDEPAHARSPLRMRLVLAVIGLACGVTGMIVSGRSGSTVWLVIFAVLTAMTMVNVAVVVIHIRQGARYQPGRGVPPG